MTREGRFGKACKLTLESDDPEEIVTALMTARRLYSDAIEDVHTRKLALNQAITNKLALDQVITAMDSLDE